MQILDDIVSTGVYSANSSILGLIGFLIQRKFLLNDDFRFVLSEHEYYVYLHLIYDSDLWLNIS